MKAPQFTQSLAKAIQNIEVPVTYELLTFKGENMGQHPVLGPSAIGHPTGLEHFPIFDEAYRKVLVGKFVDAYWNYEIAHESADMFWNAVRRWFNMEMPYYNELYRKVPFDESMLTVDLSSKSKTKTDGLTKSKDDTKTESNTTGKTSSESHSENTARAFDNQYPLSEIQEDENYGTGSNTSTGKSDSTGKGDSEGTEKGNVKGEGEVSDTRNDETESTTKGYQGNKSAMLAAFRANIVNTDKLVITAARPLFMLIMKNPDTASTKEYMRGLL